MARATGTPGPHQDSSVRMRTPAATDRSNGRWVRSSGARAQTTSRACCGFTASTTTAAPSTARALSASALTPSSRASARRAASEASPTLRRSGRTPERSRPVRSARPMWPPPRTVTCCSDMGEIVAWRVSAWPRAEQRRPHAHDGGAFLDRRLEVPAHPHREGVERGAAAVQRLEVSPQLAEPGALALGLRLLRWNAHQPPEPEARQQRDLPRESGQFARRDSAFGGFVREAHLQTDVERRCVVRALLGEPRGDLQAIDGVHPGERFSDRAGLVGLDAPDEVPGKRAILQRIKLLERFLQIALAEVPEAAGGGGAHHFGWLGLGHGKECDRVRIPAGPGGCLRDALPHRADAFR